MISVANEALVDRIEAVTLTVDPTLARAAGECVRELETLTDEQFGQEAPQRRLLAELTARVPAWREFAAELARRFDGDDLVLLRGLPFDPEDRLVIAVLASLGRVAGDGNPGGRTVFDLFTIERPPDTPDFEVFFHTGSYFRPRPHEILALLCVRPGSEGGGISRLAPLDAVLETMRRLGQGAAIDQLLQPVLFRQPKRFGGGYVEAPILARSGGDPSRLEVRFERRRVARGARGRVGGYSPDLLAAIAAFEAAANAEGSFLEYRLQRDELLLVNNRRVLHARGVVPGGRSAGRHLKRIKAYRP